MAIVTENHFEEDGRIFKKTYSDAGFVIRQLETGFCYAEAVDPHDATWTYEETNDPIDWGQDISDDNNPLDYSAQDLVVAAKILLGEVE